MKDQKKNDNKREMISVIAGGGDLPIRMIEKLKAIGMEHFIISIDGFGPVDYPQFKLGEIGKILDFIKSKKTTNVLFCGIVKRPSLFSLNLDPVGKKWLKSLGIKAFLGDNALIKGVKSLLLKEGIGVISPQSILKTLLTPAGVLTEKSPSDVDLRDIARGIFVLNTMSKADIGQSVVVQEGIVLGIEAAEGTKKLIERCSSLKLMNEKGGVLIKTSKTNQDNSIDFPTIGKSTIFEVESSSLSGIALGAFKSQIIDYDETIRLANERGIFIIGI
jgi:DUF1009 family protein